MNRPSPEKQLRVGVAGVGHMGRYHVNLLSQIPEAENVYIFDANAESVKKAAQEFGALPCESYEQLVEKSDAIVIAVPTHLHYKYAMQAIEAGKHILVEKPVAQDAEEARRMNEAASKKGVVLHVGHVERFNGAIQEIRNLLDEPQYFQCQRIGNVSRILDAGVVLDLMIHDIDLVISLAGAKVKDLSAMGRSLITDHEDYALATLYFENGITANLTASRVSTRKARTMSVAQRDSYIHLDYSLQDLTVYRNPESKYEVSKGTIKYSEESLIDRIFIHKDNPLRLELDYFIATILGTGIKMFKGSAIWDAQSNVYTMEIAMAILDDIKKRNK